MQYVEGDVCGVENCRAVQYYIEDGLWFCKNGHQRVVRLLVTSNFQLFLIATSGSCPSAGR